MKMVRLKQFLKRMARLEFINDQALAELAYLDKLLKRIGFSDGLSSVKTAAHEIYEEENEEKRLGEERIRKD